MLSCDLTHKGSGYGAAVGKRFIEVIRQGRNDIECIFFGAIMFDMIGAEMFGHFFGKRRFVKT